MKYESDRANAQMCSDAVRLLLEAGADINKRGRRGQSVLHTAFSDKRDVTIPLLLEAGADVNLHDNRGLSLLYHVSNHGDMKLIRKFLDAGAQLEYRTFHNGLKVSALFIACLQNQVEAVRLLLERGADANGPARSQDKVLETFPLVVASNRGNLGVVRLLLQYDADVQKTSFKYGAALQAAIAGNGGSGSFSRSPADWNSLVTLLLAAGAAVAPIDSSHGTPLAAATQGNNLALARQMLAFGADIDRISGDAFCWPLVTYLRDSRMTALGYAIHNLRAEMVQILLEHGASLNHCVLQDDAIDLSIEHSIEYMRSLSYETAIDQAARRRKGITTKLQTIENESDKISASAELHAIDNIITLLSDARASREQKLSGLQTCNE
jgi:ankyrin repeat protein